MKKQQREKAIYLRQVEGLSLNQICQYLGAAKSSVSGWVKDVKLTKKQLAKLDERNPAKPQFIGKRIVSDLNRERFASVRRSHQQIGRDDCNEFDLHLAGCMLYWGEGTKNKNALKFTNTDASMVALFVRFIRECYAIPDDKISIYCRSHILSQYGLAEIESYWLRVLGLRNENLRKSSVETRIPKKKSVKYPYGICTVCVNNTKLVQRVFGSIKEYAGISQPNLWLY